MWLLNTSTLHLRFFASSKPDYAILSHRWEEEEVSFRQFNDAGMVQWVGRDETEHEKARKKKELEEFPLVTQLEQYHRKQLFSMKGMQKIRSFCMKARDLEFEWAWADTCCIDKSSSSELQEAINSMFKWYLSSKTCIVFLRDVNIETEERVTLRQFRYSEWFLRGWTLQELLAPDSHEFVDRNWQTFGTTKPLLEDISAGSGIPTGAFSGGGLLGLRSHFRLTQYNIAEKMSWAARRRTTREEDLAYCLLGLFNVNMPLLYGEGLEKAFERLQLEILKSSTDETMFVSEPHFFPTSYGGLLALTPRDFSNYDLKRHIRNSRKFGSRTSFEYTSHGLRIGTVLQNEIVGSKQQAHVKELKKSYSERGLYFMPLRCFGFDPGNVIFIPLARASGPGGNKFVRVGSWVEATCDVQRLFDNNLQQDIYISLTYDQAKAAFLEAR